MKPAGVYRKGELSIYDILKSVKENPDFGGVGAIGIFIGVARGESLEGEVTKLEIEAYEDKADAVLSAICKGLRKKKGISDVRIYHNLGEFAPSDDLVYVIVAGGHRNDVFRVLKEAVERYKREAPIFKKEHLVVRETGKNLTRWVGDEPRNKFPKTRTNKNHLPDRT